MISEDEGNNHEEDLCNNCMCYMIAGRRIYEKKAEEDEGEEKVNEVD